LGKIVTFQLFVFVIVFFPTLIVFVLLLSSTDIEELGKRDVFRVFQRRKLGFF
jgi:hypothetical protein